MKNAPPVSPLCAFNYPAFEEVANSEPDTNQAPTLTVARTRVVLLVSWLY